MSASTSKATSRCKNLDLDLGDISRPKVLKRDDYDDILSEEDRISSIPDEVLSNILSLLPSKDAVVTSVLSRRWRRVYTWVTHLDFDDSSLCQCVRSFNLINSVPNFKIFVDNVLHLCQSSIIATYRLHFGKHDCCHFRWHKDPKYFPEMEPMHLKAWMCFPLSRQVKELDICAHVKIPGNLPSEIFHCQTVEVLKVNANLRLEVPVSIHLPNLKEFRLTIPVIPDGDFVTRIVSSCPSIQILSLLGHWDAVNPIHISSTSLRRLKIFATNLRDYCPGQRPKVVLDVPNLEHLSYLDLYALHYSIGHMNALVEAEVEVVGCLRETIVSLSQLLTDVRILSVMDCWLMTLNNSDSKLQLPIFQNLNRLHLGYYDYCDWNRVLMELLNCAPFLETLAFQGGITDIDNCFDDYYVEVSERECRSWNCTQIVPSCLVRHLKRITIKDYLTTDWELEMVKYFLRNSLVLEELDIYMKMGGEQYFNREVQMLPRGSDTCSIKVSGIQRSSSTCSRESGTLFYLM